MTVEEKRRELFVVWAEANGWDKLLDEPIIEVFIK